MSSTDDLLTFAGLPDVIKQQIGRRRVLRWAKEGRFPQAIHLGGYSEPLFSARQVAAWLAARLAPAAASLPALQPAWDGEPDDPRHGVAS